MTRGRRLDRLLRRGIAAIVTAATLAGCAGMPPAGTPEYDAWIREKQELSAAIEKAGCYCGASWFRDLPTN
ncbi:MAG: hypothetical protein KJ018_05940 [Burkholderiales bacterium]|nr:hypothetical protein [Burkholderiales bacterium]